MKAFVGVRADDVRSAVEAALKRKDVRAHQKGQEAAIYIGKLATLAIRESRPTVTLDHEAVAMLFPHIWEPD